MFCLVRMLDVCLVFCEGGGEWWTVLRFMSCAMLYIYIYVGELCLGPAHLALHLVILVKSCVHDENDSSRAARVLIFA